MSTTLPQPAILSTPAAFDLYRLGECVLVDGDGNGSRRRYGYITGRDEASAMLTIKFCVGGGLEVDGRQQHERGPQRFGFPIPGR